MNTLVNSKTFVCFYWSDLHHSSDLPQAPSHPRPTPLPLYAPPTQPPSHHASQPPSQPPSRPATQPPSHPANPPQTAFSTPLNLRDSTSGTCFFVKACHSARPTADIGQPSICHAHRQQARLLNCFCAWVCCLLLVSFLLCGCCGSHCALHTS